MSATAAIQRHHHPTGGAPFEIKATPRPTTNATGKMVDTISARTRMFHARARNGHLLPWDSKLATPRYKPYGPVYDEQDASWKRSHAIHEQTDSPLLSFSSASQRYAATQRPVLPPMQDLRQHTYGRLDETHPSLLRVKGMHLMWQSTMFYRVIRNIVFLEIWAVLARWFLYSIGLEDGILDSTVTQLITVLIFVLGIIMGNSINMGMVMFQRPLDMFRADLLHGISSVVNKACMYTTAAVAVSSDGGEKAEVAMARCVEVLEAMKLTCACLPMALFEEFAPQSYASVIDWSHWTRLMPAVHEVAANAYSDHLARSRVDDHSAAAAADHILTNRTVARNWKIEVDDLSILCLTLETCLNAIQEWRTTFSMLSEVDALRTNVGRLRTLVESKLPEPYLNLILIFTYVYLLSFPLFFSVYKWWLDVIVYFMVCYVILGTYELSEQLRKERGFDNKHTYIPFLSWCNETIADVSLQVDTAVHFVNQYR